MFEPDSSTTAITDHTLYQQVLEWESQNGGGPFMDQAST